MATEAGMVDAKDIKPVLMRFLPATRKKMATLPAERAGLQREIRSFIHKMGPELGSLYTDKTVNWEEFIRKSSSAADLQSLLLNEATQGQGQPGRMGSPTSGAGGGGGDGGAVGLGMSNSGSITSPALATAVNGRESPPAAVRFPSGLSRFTSGAGGGSAAKKNE